MSDTENIIDSSHRHQVNKRFHEDFNCISLQLLEKAYPCLFEHVIYPDNYDLESDEPLYPMWGTLFEAKDQIVSNLLKEKINELQQIGIHLMQVDETNAMMFIQGAGYNFYDAHWIPLYRDVFKWLK